MAALRLRSSRAGPVRQLRLFVARRPLVHWLLIGAGRGADRGLVYRGPRARRRPAHRWGTARSVVVAVRDLPAGHRVEPGDVRRQSWPAALGAIPARCRPWTTAVVVAAPVVAGEPVVRSRLGRARAGPVAGPRWRPGDGPSPSPCRGHAATGRRGRSRSTLVAAGSALAARRRGPGASVVAVQERAVVVAVTADELSTVAGGWWTAPSSWPSAAIHRGAVTAPRRTWAAGAVSAPSR